MDSLNKTVIACKSQLQISYSSPRDVFGTKKTQQLRERQRATVTGGSNVSQRLAAGATGVKQKRCRRGPTRGIVDVLGTCCSM